MVRQELSQTNVFHQTAVWAALHKGIEGGRMRRSEGMCACGKLEAGPRGNQSELLHPPSASQNRRGLRCVLHKLIPSKLDCLCRSNQSFVNESLGNDSPIMVERNHNMVHHKLEIS
ncbi:hypothetical protein ILYODFUR_004034 [Ilyodon furcidens]|uniref:Uncharacterized protein n=1 Tax=Ilyodon furcidens TaxID=33524 RepID=A0ABV0VBQ8_9TELE